MMRPALFVQECPTCGRSLRVRIDLLGRSVACQHCQAQFLARDGSRFSRDADLAWRPGIMERAQALLDASDTPPEPTTRPDKLHESAHLSN